MLTPLNQLLSLNGKSAIVTGGAKGIGYGIAYRLAEAGAKVLVADLDETSAQKTAQELISKDWTAVALKIDVSNEEEVKNMILSCQAQFGSLDILVNNAGIYPPSPIAQMSKADFQKVLDVNLGSVFLTTKYGAEVMKQQSSGGKIINVSSIDALHPSMIGLAHYDASKHGLWGFTKNAALEFAPHKIWINAIAPGGIQTPGIEAMQAQAQTPINIDPRQMIEAFLAKIPMHRMGDPDEIGKVALFLASDMSSYMTGEQVVVDGGALLS